jgi:hypothetical protein
MRRFLALVSFAGFALASCGNPNAADDVPLVSEKSGQVASCHPTCQTAADCGAPGDPLYDSSHFACQAGLCQWQGCRSAAECSTAAHGGHFVCQPFHGGPPPAGALPGQGAGPGVPVCVPACQQASDCVPHAPHGSAVPGLMDASHFSCVAGACVWSGCRATAECSSAAHTAKIACEEPPGAPSPTCVPTCTTASDCVIPGTGKLGDVHHYACHAGRCQWLGCRSTPECRTAMSSNSYVCE